MKVVVGTFLILFLIKAKAQIRCELEDFGNSDSTDNYLLISPKEEDRYEVEILSQLEVLGKSISRTTHLCPKDHFITKLNSADELKIKFVKRIKGVNLNRVVYLDLDKRQGHLIQESAKYNLLNCEMN